MKEICNKYTALLVGISSFTGKALANLLYSDEQWGITGTYNTNNLVDKYYKVYQLDVLDADKVRNVVDKVRPTHIFNMTGWTVGDDPHMFYMLHSQGVLNILEAARSLEKKPRVIMVGTAAEYGIKKDAELPITEEAVTSPNTHYGRSKLIQTALCLYAANYWKVPVMVARAFNLIGKDMPDHLAPPMFFQQIKNVQSNNKESIITKGLESRRDYLDIRDAVTAYLAIAEKGESGEIYNVCSGNAVSMRYLLKRMCDEVGMSGVKIKSSDAESERSSNINISLGSYNKLEQATGWKPTITIEKAVRDFIK